MLNPVEFKHCFAVQKLDAIPFIATIGGMIAFGLAEGIGIGCLSAWALNYDSDKFDLQEMEFPHKEIDTPEEKTKETKSTAKDFGTVETDNMKLRARIVTLQTDNTQLRGIVRTLQNENKLIRDRLETLEIENAELRGLFETLTAQDSDSERPTKSTIGWQLKGPINFGSMFKIDDLIHRIEEMKADEKVIVLDMQETTAVEFTGVEELVNRLVEVADQNPGTSIQMWNCHGELQNALQQCGLLAIAVQSRTKLPISFHPRKKSPVRKRFPIGTTRPTFGRMLSQICTFLQY